MVEVTTQITCLVQHEILAEMVVSPIFLASFGTIKRYLKMVTCPKKIGAIRMPSSMAGLITPTLWL